MCSKPGAGITGQRGIAVCCPGVSCLLSEAKDQADIRCVLPCHAAWAQAATGIGRRCWRVLSKGVLAAALLAAVAVAAAPSSAACSLPAIAAAASAAATVAVAAATAAAAATVADPRRPLLDG